MTKIKQLFVLAALLFLPSVSKAIDYNWSLPIKVTSPTEVASAVATNSTGSIVLANNANRLAWDIQVTTCTSPTTKVFYSFGATLSTVTASASQWTSINNGANLAHIVQPGFIGYTGPISMAAEATGCVVNVRELTSTSPIFQ